MTIEAEAQNPPPPRGIPALKALVAPDEGMEKQARVGKVWPAFLIAWVCALLVGAAAAYRVDARESTLKRLEMMGQIANMSDRQIDEEVKTGEKKFIVTTVAANAFQPGLMLLANALAIVGLGWFLRGKQKSGAIFPVSAAVLLPNAVANLLNAITIFRRPVISPDETQLAPRTLTDIMAAVGHPLMGAMMKLGSALDFFSLWAAVLMGFGIAASTTVPVRRAVIGTLVAWVCLRLLTNVAGGGHP